MPSLLIVDDEVDICHNYADIFSDLGYDVAVAHSGMPALEMVRQRPYDVALLDLKMPGMDGLTLYREIKKLRAGTVAMILTGFASHDVASAALAAGVAQVLSKPADIPRLLELMGAVLEQPLVLVVDDDESLCASLWDLLRERGYRVCMAHDQDQAAARLHDREYELVLVDMKLPVGDGPGVVRLVKQSNTLARIIAITGFRAESEQAIQQLVAEGVQAVCYKPFDVPELLNTIDDLTRST